MSPLSDHFEQFVRERAYLQNVTPKTLDWYQTAWKSFQRWQRSLPERQAPSPLICRADLQQFVIHLRDRGVKPISCNSWLRVLNTFCRWLHEQGHIAQAGSTAPAEGREALAAAA